MSKIREKNTKPEMILRSALHKLGYRFRIHSKHLPGRPDIVLAKYNMIIFVHGCFWHQHKYCTEGRIPSTNSKYWEEKFSNNAIRDKRNKKALRKMGWKVIIVWECEIEGKIEKVMLRIIRKTKSSKFMKYI
ncbi:MAG: very short patch repair endonuclease [Ignavibacteriales bacterium]|nr:very short patch repair endonuclease [Ignavibacteriales bacterium]